MRKKLKKIEEFEEKTIGDVSLNVSEIEAVDYYVVIPKKASPEDLDNMQERKTALSKFERAKRIPTQPVIQIFLLVIRLSLISILLI